MRAATSGREDLNLRLSWSQTTRSTKLSYAPNMQRVVYHGFSFSRIWGAHAARDCDWRPRQSLLLRVQRLPQIRRESFFHCGYGFVSPGRVINCLIASDLPDPEIFRFRMRKIEPAHAGAGMHRKRLRQFHPCVVLCIEQIKERSFLGVIWTGWITGSGPDAAIFFADQISIRQLFVAPKSPSDASFFMKIFGKRFS